MTPPARKWSPIVNRILANLRILRRLDPAAARKIERDVRAHAAKVRQQQASDERHRRRRRPA